MKPTIDEILVKVAAGEMTESKAYDLIRGIRPTFAGPADAKSTTNFDFEDVILRDHQLLGERVLMGVVHCSLALDALRARVPNHDNGFWLEKVTLREAIRARPAERVTVRVELTESGDEFTFQNWFGLQEDQMDRVSAQGRLGCNPGETAGPIELEKLRSAPGQTLTGEWFYERHTAYGRSLRTLQRAWILEDGVLGEYRLPDEAPVPEGRFAIHPCGFDSAYVNSLCAARESLGSALWVPVFIRRAEITRPFPPRWFCLTRVVRLNQELLVTDHEYYACDGQYVGRIKGFTIKRVPEGLGALPSTAAASAVSEQDPAEELAASDSLVQSIENFLSSRIGRVLGAQPSDVGIDKPFLEFGAESSSLIRLVEDIEKEIGVELYPTLFFEYQTIRELSRYLEAEHGAKFAARLAAPPAASPITERAPAPKPPALERALRKIAADGTATSSRDIAVIGMAGRFAQSNTLEEFWRHLRDGTDLIREIPHSRWDWRPWFDAKPQTPHRTYCRWGSFLDDVDKFDPLFFNMSPREAEATDPQLRLLLEVMYEATENAGYAVSIR